MKRYLISCTAMAALTLLLCQPLAAQDKEKDKDNDKEKTKISDSEEIIIKRKGDKDSKITIEIKGDEITVNGKPLADFDDDNIVIRKSRSTRVYGFSAAPHSPFRGQGGTLSFDSRPGLLDNSAFLGVITEKAEKGARIEKVTENSAAGKAGLKEGDVITKVDDATIEKPEDLTKAIRKHKPEDKVTVTYERNGKSNKTDVTLGKTKGKMMQSPHFDAMPDFNFDWKDGDMGPRIAYGKPRIGIKAQDTEDGKGVKVLEIDNGSVAEKAGVVVGDVITEFDGKKVNSTDELASAAREAKDKTSFKVTFNRDGKSQTVEVKIPKKLKTANL